MHIAQLQHPLVFDALARRESARIEMPTREHPWADFRYGPLLDSAAALS